MDHFSYTLSGAKWTRQLIVFNSRTTVTFAENLLRGDTCSEARRILIDRAAAHSNPKRSIFQFFANMYVWLPQMPVLF